MGIKKTLASIILTAAAGLLNFGCDKQTKIEYRDVDHWQTPIAHQIHFSDDGTNAAMMVQEKDDYEVYMFNSASNSCANLSKDPVNSDFPVAFAGNNAITVSHSPDGNTELEIYDASGNLAFNSGAFEWIDDNDVTVCSQGTKIVFGASVAGSGSNVYLHRIGSQALEEIVQGATSAYLGPISQDKSIVYIQYFMPVIGQVLGMYDTETEVLTPVLNLGGHNVRYISKNNKKALMEYWTGSGDGLKVHDVDTNTVQIVNVPAGKTYQYADLLSDDGTGAVFMVRDNVTQDFEWYHLDTDTLTVSLMHTMPSTTNQWFSADISSNGNIVSLRDTSDIISLYNQATLEFYDPLSAIPKEESELVGFTLDDKVVLAYYEPMTWREDFVLHDPVTKTNTPIAEAGYDMQSSVRATPDRKYFAFSAEEDATGWEVVVLKDLVNNTTKIIKPTFASDCDYVGATSDSSRIYLRTEYQDLVAYDMASDSFVQITNNASSGTSSGFKIIGHSKDNKKLFFSENKWNDTETIKQYDFDTRETKIVAYSD